jgi:hypothetical protein
VRIGVHYIAFWCVFGLCGIQPLEILDFCGNTRKNLMKASKCANTTHFPCRHVSTISKHYTFPNQVSTISKHYTFPNQVSTILKHYTFPNQVSTILKHYTFPNQVSTISKPYTFPNQTCKNCVHHIKTLHFC